MQQKQIYLGDYSAICINIKDCVLSPCIGSERNSFTGLCQKNITCQRATTLVRLFSDHVQSTLPGTKDNIFFSIEDFYVATKMSFQPRKVEKGNSFLPAQGLLIEITVLQIGQTSVCRWGPPAVTEKLFPELVDGHDL